MAGLKDKRGFIDKDRLDLSERKAQIEADTKAEAEERAGVPARA